MPRENLGQNDIVYGSSIVHQESRVKTDSKRPYTSQDPDRWWGKKLFHSSEKIQRCANASTLHDHCQFYAPNGQNTLEILFHGYRDWQRQQRLLAWFFLESSRQTAATSRVPPIPPAPTNDPANKPRLKILWAMPASTETIEPLMITNKALIKTSP